MVGILIGFVISIVLLANSVIYAVMAIRRMDDGSQDLCWKCGYSLRGDLDVPTCPECGALFR